MLGVRKQDPEFVAFTPKTAEEAVDRFVRCKRRGLKAYLVPECLIACAHGLPPSELEKFESWIINPCDDFSNVSLVEQKSIRESNDAIFAENARRVEDKMQVDELPPLPREQEDEKMCDTTPESLPDTATLSIQ
jgi:hypothetical protein